MSSVDILSNLIFLIMGLFGISVQLKETNYSLLVGSIGIIVIVLTQYINGEKQVVLNK